MNTQQALVGRAAWVAGAVSAVALALAVAGCGSAASRSGSGSPAGAITLKATDFAYTPAKVSLVGPGDVKVTLQNQGMLEHDFVIEGVQGTLLVKPNSTGSAVFKLPKAGTYTFACSVQGHKEAGMKGTLTVG